jgi:hypothetical protein
MKLLLLALVLVIPFVVGYLVGKARQPAPPDQAALLKELHQLRETQRHVMLEAAKHATLGDDFAVIALGIISDEEQPHDR